MDNFHMIMKITWLCRDINLKILIYLSTVCTITIALHFTEEHNFSCACGALWPRKPSPVTQNPHEPY